MPINTVNNQEVNIENEKNIDWYARVVVGGVSILGIATLSYKMGGPVGKAIRTSLEHQVDDFAEHHAAKLTERPVNFEKVAGSYKYEIITPEGDKVRPGELLSDEKLSIIQDQHYSINGSSQHTINEVNRLQNEIKDIVYNSKKGTNIYDQLSLLNGINHNFTEDVVGSGPKRGQYFYLIQAAQIKTIRTYVANDLKASDALPDNINIFGSDIDNISADDLPHMMKLHTSLVNDNKKYLEEYAHQLEKIHKTLRFAISAELSVPFNQMRMFVPSQYSSVNQTLTTIIGEQVKLINHSDKLLNISKDTKNSRMVVNNTIANGTAHQVISNNIKNDITLHRYLPQLNTISNIFTELTHNHSDKIEGASIELKHFDTSNGEKRAYFEMRIKRNYGSKVEDFVNIIPIEDIHNGIASTSNLRGRQMAAIEFTTNSMNHAISTTQAYLRSYIKTLTSSIMNDVLNKQISEHSSTNDTLNYGIKSIEESLPDLQNEGRDIYKRYAVRELAVEDIRGVSESAQKRKFAQIQHGCQGLMNLKRIKSEGGKVKVITFDLETLQSHGKTSPTWVPRRESSGLWQAGFTIHDVHGRVDDIVEIASDHVLQEHKLLHHYNAGTLLRAISNDESIREIAEYAAETLGVTSNPKLARDETLAKALSRYIEVIKSKSGVTGSNNRFKGQMAGITDSHDFAHRYLKLLENEVIRLKNDGYEVVLNSANGMDFDGELLNTLTAGKFRNIEKLVTVIDITNIKRMLNQGAEDVTGDQLVRIAQEWVLKSGKFKGGNIDFVNPKNLLNTLRLLSNPGNGILKATSGGSVFEMLQRAIGKGNNIEAHTSAATDTLMETMSFVSLFDIFNKEGNALERQARYAESVIEKFQLKAYKKVFQDTMELEGQVVDGKMLTGGGLTNTQLGKNTRSAIGTAMVNPFLSGNSMNRQQHQYTRHGYINKHKSNSPFHRWLTVVTSPLEQHSLDLAYRGAELDKNMFAAKVAFRTAYAIGSAGMQMGHAGILKSIRDEELANRFVSHASIELDMGLHNFGPSNEFNTELMTLISNAKKNAGQFHKIKSDDVISSHLLEEFIQKELVDNNNLYGNLTLNPANPITREYLLGANKVELSQSGIGRLTGIKFSNNKHDNDKIGRIMLQYQFSSSINSSVINYYSGRSVFTAYDVDPEVMLRASRSKGISTAIEVTHAFEHIEKGHAGAFKQAILENALYGINHILSDGAENSDGRKYSKLDKTAAKKALRDLQLLINTHEQTTRINGTNGIGLCVGPNKEAALGGNSTEVLDNISRISYDQLLRTYSAIGHDFTWDLKKMEKYYGLFTSDPNGDMWKGRTVLNKVIGKEIDFGKHTASENILKGLSGFIDANDGIEKYLDPLSKAEYELKRQGLLKGSSLQQLIAKNRVVADKLIRGLAMPVIVQAAPNMVNMSQVGESDKGILAFVTYNQSVITAENSKITEHFNREVEFKHIYFGNFMASPFLPKSFRELLVNNTGAHVNSKHADVARTFRKMIDAMQNNNVSSLVKYELGLDSLNKMFARQDTLNTLDKMLKQVEDSNENRARQLQIAFKTFNDLGYQLSEDHKNNILNGDIRLLKAHFNKLSSNQNFITSVDAQKILSDNNIGFLPSTFYFDENGKHLTMSEAEKYKKLGLNVHEKGKAFEFNLSEFQRSNASQYDKDKLSIDSIIKFSEEQKRQLQAEGEYSSTKLGFNVVERGGDKIIVMNGLIVPMFKEVGNVFDKHGEIDGLGTGNEHYRFFRETTNAYKIYYDSVINAKKDYSPIGLGHDVVLNGIRLLATTLNTKKNSDFHASTQTSTLSGSRKQYETNDLAVHKAQSTLEGVGNKKGYGYDKIQEFWKKHNYSVDEQQMMLKRLNVLVSKGSTVSVFAAEDMMSGKIQFNMNDGKRTTIVQMKQDARHNKDFNLVKELRDAEKGLNTLPGFMNRFPTESGGLAGVLMVDMLALPINEMEFLGLNTHRLNLNSIYGDLLKADTDADETEAILQAYRTSKALNDARAEKDRIHQDLFQHYDVKNAVNRYNNSGNLVGIDNDGMYKVSKMLGNSSLVMEHMTAEDYVAQFGDKNIIHKHYSMMRASSDKWADMVKLRKGYKAAEQHLATVAVSDFSSRIIGLVTNTMRQNVQQIHQLNTMMPERVADLTSMLGTINSGTAALTQLAIKMNKHTTTEQTNDLISVLQFFQNPTKATSEEYYKAKSFWNKMYEDNPEITPDELEKQNRFFEGVFVKGRKMTQILDEEFPTLKELQKNQMSTLTGADSSDFFKLLRTESQFDTEIQKAHTLLMENGQIAEQLINQTADRIEGSRSNIDFTFVDSMEYAGKSIRKNANLQLDGSTVKNFMSSKAGRFGAGAALAYLGINMFMPMTGMLGVSKTSENNTLFASELQLSRKLPIDTINASFSKEAFAYINDRDQSTEKSNMSSMIQSNIERTLFRHDAGMEYVKVDAKIHNSSTMNYIGPFGNMNYNRSL